MPDTHQTREKLARILGLLSSDQDGEVLSAARAAVRLMAVEGLEWDRLLFSTALAPTEGWQDHPLLAARLRIHHPTDALPPLSPPHLTWRETAYVLLSGRHGTQAQREYLGRIGRSGVAREGMWRPTYPQAAMLVAMHRVAFGRSAAA